jgi:DHA1 family bicyclomycin/chloramphenicol resistance-like MFS transporter
MLSDRRFLIVALMAACGALAPIALQIIVPVLPYMRGDLGTSIADTQWTVTGFSAALGISMLVIGPLADRYGRRPLLIGGMLLFTAGSLLAWLAPDLNWLVAGRIVQAIGAGAASTIGRVVAADLFAGADLGKVFAYMTMAMVIGPMVAPVLAGLMADQWGWRSILLLLLLLGAAFTLLTIGRVPETGGAEERPADASWTEALAGGRLFFYLATLTATQIGIYALISASPYIVVELLGHSATEYGLYFVVLTLGFLGGNFLSTRIAHRLGPDRTIVLGLLVFAGAWAALAWSLSRPEWSAWALFAPGTVLGGCNGLIQPNCHAAAMNGAGAAKGTAASLSGFTQVMAGATGLQLMAWLQPGQVDPGAMVRVIGWSAAAAVIMAILFLLRANTRKAATV